MSRLPANIKALPEIAAKRREMAAIYRRARMTNRAIARSMWKQVKAVHAVEMAALMRGELA